VGWPVTAAISSNPSSSCRSTSPARSAAAEAAGLTVLHYDHDFDLIAEVTGQPVEWVVPRGTVP